MQIKAKLIAAYSACHSQINSNVKHITFVPGWLIFELIF